MATGATGTPPSTNLSIPKINPQVDPPDGSGINSIVDFIDGIIIPDTLVDAKGDLIVATAADAVARVAVGANDTILTADSAQASGIKWAAPAASTSAMTLIDDHTVAGAVLAAYDTDLRIGVNALPQTYKHLKIIMTARMDVAGNGGQVQLNGDTAANYMHHQALANSAARSDTVTLATTNIYVSVTPGTTDTANRWSVTEVLIPNYTSAVIRKLVSSTTHGYQQAALYTGQFGGEWTGTAAIIRLKLFPNTGNFAIGSRFSLYGIS